MTLHYITLHYIRHTREFAAGALGALVAAKLVEHVRWDVPQFVMRVNLVRAVLYFYDYSYHHHHHHYYY